MATTNNIGKAIKAAREQAGLTQHDLGERIGDERIADAMRAMSAVDLVWLISGSAGPTPARYVVAGREELLRRLAGRQTS